MLSPKTYKYKGWPTKESSHLISEVIDIMVNKKKEEKERW